MSDLLLSKLANIDEWKKIDGLPIESYIHRDHRYCLVPAFYKSISPDFEPMTLIGFDFHHDTCVPTPAALKKMSLLKNTKNIDDFIDFVKNDLGSNDDDWIIAGMELGLIDDAVIFGINQDTPSSRDNYVDSQNRSHKIIQTSSVPGQMFGYQDALSDISRKKASNDLWDTIGWQLDEKSKKFVLNMNKKFWINIDLDCFIMSWQDYIFPWKEVVFRDRFIKDTSYGAAEGWTGKKFTDEIIKNSKLLTICTEPECCGGRLNSATILKRLNQYMFNKKLQITDSL